jgi:hypothetical protein
MSVNIYKYRYHDTNGGAVDGAHPIQRRKNRLIAVSLSMVAIIFANALDLRGNHFDLDGRSNLNKAFSYMTQK